MGYSTDFFGEFILNKPLDAATLAFLKKFSETRRMKRNVGPEYGVEGELYVNGTEQFGQGRDANIVDYNRPPSTQPGLWCQWTPNDEGTAIVWDEGEKFYGYIEWIQYIITTILEPRGYALSGEVEWRGEDSEDRGIISIQNNKVKIKRAVTTFVEE